VDDDWRDRRREAADAQAERAARARTADVELARRLVTEFVAEAQRRGLATTELRARAGDTSATYRCGLVGWYLRRDGSLGVTEGGDMYVLTAPRSFLAAIRGVTLTPTEPRTQAGIGARDGESIALASLLALRLDAGDDWPILR